LGWIDANGDQKARYDPFAVEFLHDTKSKDWNGKHDASTFMRSEVMKRVRIILCCNIISVLLIYRLQWPCYLEAAVLITSRPN
jgi:hypothetical protein